MPVNFTVSDDGSYLIQRVIGHHTAVMQREVVRDLSTQIAQAGVRKVLVDARMQLRPIGLTDGYQIWAELAWHLPWRTTFAVVVRADHQTARFLEIIARIRGHAGRYFDDYNEALAWLSRV